MAQWKQPVSWKQPSAEDATDFMSLTDIQAVTKHFFIAMGFHQDSTFIKLLLHHLKCKKFVTTCWPNKTLKWTTSRKRMNSRENLSFYQESLTMITKLWRTAQLYLWETAPKMPVRSWVFHHPNIQDLSRRCKTTLKSTHVKCDWSGGCQHCGSFGSACDDSKRAWTLLQMTQWWISHSLRRESVWVVYKQCLCFDNGLNPLDLMCF